MEKYYKILGLTSNASKADVKKAYRKLALLYHPDKNTDPKAQEVFVLINIAYETINNPGKPKEVSLRTPAKNSFDERIRVAKIRQDFQNARKKKQEEEFYNKLTNGLYWRLLKVILVFGLFTNVILVLDQFLPCHYEKSIVRHVRNTNYNGIVHNDVADLYLIDNTRIFYNRRWYGKFENDPTIYLKKSWLSHTIIEIGEPNEIVYRNKKGKIISKTLWSKTDFNVLLLPLLSFLLCLAPFLTVYNKSKNIKFTLLYITTFTIATPFILYFWLGDYRLFHLISLGFW